MRVDHKVLGVVVAAGITVGSLLGVSNGHSQDTEVRCPEDSIGFTQWNQDHQETFACIAIDDFLEEYPRQQPGVPAEIYLDYLDMLIKNEYGVWTEGHKQFVYEVLANVLVGYNE